MSDSIDSVVSFDAHDMQAAPFDRPFILFMGPQRAGTTWIDQYVRQRGDVCMPTGVKELFFFNKNYGRGVGFFTKHFSLSAAHKALSKVSTLAFDCADAPQRVRDTLGRDVVLVCPLRHPVERSYSLYKHYKRYGLVQGSLQEACRQNPQILTSSYYAQHLERWFQVFPRAQVHFMYQEDMDRDSAAYAQRLCDVMGLEYRDLPQRGRVRVNQASSVKSHKLAFVAQNIAEILRSFQLYSVINFAKALGAKQLFFGRDGAGSSGGMSADERAWLDERLGDEIDKLEALIGPIPQWRDTPDERAPKIRAS